jgi:hypothetical protein
MRNARTLLPGILAVCLGGCVIAHRDDRSSWTSRFRGFQGPTGPDVVVMHVAKVERPVGDDYVNHDLWKFADEQVVGLETKAILDENGFRVGQIGGNTPAGLLKLLTSGKSNANPHGCALRAGNPAALVVGPREDRCEFKVHRDGGTVNVELVGAEFVLSVVPSPAEDGRTRLRFVPLVRHGSPVIQPRPAADRSGWTMQAQQPQVSYPELGWEVALSPNEFVVVGGRGDRPGTIGHRSFIRPDEPVPVQRLLVIRSVRAPTGGAQENLEETAPEFSLLSKAPPIAAQAALTGVRARPR